MPVASCSSRWACAARLFALNRYSRALLRAHDCGFVACSAVLQGFAEKLFKRLQHGHERFETRMAMLNLISRTVGVHKLLLLNFYPFLQVGCTVRPRGCAFCCHLLPCTKKSRALRAGS
jgi:hypothetical protein